MGFFSKIKKIWKKTEVTPQPESSTEPIVEQIEAELPREELRETTPPSESTPEPPRTAESAKRPTTEPEIEQVIEPVLEPVIELSAESVVEPLAEKIPEPPAPPTPTPAPDSRPVPNPLPEPVAEPEAEPVAKPRVASEPERTIEPEVHPEVEPIVEPAPEIVVEPVAEPVVKTVVQPVSEPVTAPAPEPEPEPEPVKKTKPSFFRKLLGGRKEPAPEMVAAPEPKELPKEPAPLPDTYTQDKPKAVKRPAWQTDLLQSLENAEPKLSIWLEHLLTGVSERGEVLWDRLHFLLGQLEVPKKEAEDFVHRFDVWLEDMDYERVEEFRSELQYRLALALDLEDEEDEQSRLFLKLSEGLNKTREQLSKRIDQLLSISGSFDETFWEELEEILIMADVGYDAAHKLLERLKPKVAQKEIGDAQAFKDLLRAELVEIFNETERAPKKGTPEVVLMVGVNGVGKTTTIAKLAHRSQMQGKKVLVAAGDTFRAAAIEQLKIWAKRVGAGFYAKEHGADPAAVAYEAMTMGLEEGYDQIFMDTAGRIHTKVDLMEELKKIKRVLGKKMEGAPHRTILVLDATTGQNALSQVKLFSQAVDLDEIVLTKLDGTAKGGIIVAVALEFNVPISFIGLGEQMEDLRPFSGEDFAKALLG